MATSLFLSCVTSEFRLHREMLTQDLNVPEVKVYTQESFVTGGGTLLEKLSDLIQRSDAVIHLVGQETGAFSKPEECESLLLLYPDMEGRLKFCPNPSVRNGICLSYSQWEAWLAYYFRKPCLVYRYRSAMDSDEEHSLGNCCTQKRHWQMFAAHGKDRKQFENAEELRRFVLRDINYILSLSQANRRLKRRRSTIAVMIGALVLPMLPLIYSFLTPNDIQTDLPLLLPNSTPPTETPLLQIGQHRLQLLRSFRNGRTLQCIFGVASEKPCTAAELQQELQTVFGSVNVDDFDSLSEVRVESQNVKLRIKNCSPQRLRSSFYENQRGDPYTVNLEPEAICEWTFAIPNWYHVGVQGENDAVPTDLDWLFVPPVRRLDVEISLTQSGTTKHWDWIITTSPVLNEPVKLPK